MAYACVRAFVLSRRVGGLCDLSLLSLSRCLRVISGLLHHGTRFIPPSLHLLPLPLWASNDFLNLFSCLLRALSECLNAYANQARSESGGAQWGDVGGTFSQNNYGWRECLNLAEGQGRVCNGGGRYKEHGLMLVVFKGIVHSKKYFL